MLCSFLLYSEVSQLYVYIYLLPLGPLFHPPPAPAFWWCLEKGSHSANVSGLLTAWLWEIQRAWRAPTPLAFPVPTCLLMPKKILQFNSANLCGSSFFLPGKRYGLNTDMLWEGERRDSSLNEKIIPPEGLSRRVLKEERAQSIGSPKGAGEEMAGGSKEEGHSGKSGQMWWASHCWPQVYPEHTVQGEASRFLKKNTEGCCLLFQIHIAKVTRLLFKRYLCNDLMHFCLHCSSQ